MSRRLIQLHAGIAGLALLRLYPKGPLRQLMMCCETCAIGLNSVQMTRSILSLK